MIYIRFGLVLRRADDHDGYAISVTLLSILGLSAVQILSSQLRSGVCSACYYLLLELFYFILEPRSQRWAHASLRSSDYAPIGYFASFCRN